MQNKLMQKLLSVVPRDGALSPTDITAKIRSCVSNNNIKFITQRSNITHVDQVLVGGTYDEYNDKEGDPYVEIILYYHPDQQHLDVAKVDWTRVCFEITETIGHEMVHRDQSNRKRKKIRGYVSRDTRVGQRREQEYLGHPDEIEAYGFSIALELVLLHQVKELDEVALGEIVMWNAYAQAFAEDQSVLVKLQKQIVKYLRRLEVPDNEKTNETTRTQ